MSGWQDLKDDLALYAEWLREHPEGRVTPTEAAARRLLALWQQSGQPTDLFYEVAFDIGDGGGLELNTEKLARYLFLPVWR